MPAMKEARKKSGLTQAQAAQASGIPLGTLRRWEQGVNQPDIDSMILLANLYGVSVDELLGSKFYTAESKSDALTTDEHELLGIYRRLDDAKRDALLGVARAM